MGWRRRKISAEHCVKYCVCALSAELTSRDRASTIFLLPPLVESFRNDAHIGVFLFSIFFNLKHNIIVKLIIYLKKKNKQTFQRIIYYLRVSSFSSVTFCSLFISARGKGWSVLEIIILTQPLPKRAGFILCCFDLQLLMCPGLKSIAIYLLRLCCVREHFRLTFGQSVCFGLQLPPRITGQ